MKTLAVLAIGAGMLVLYSLAVAFAATLAGCAEGETVDRGALCELNDCEVLPAGAPGQGP